MKCKHCNEELMDDVIICPACGGDNSGPRKKNWNPVIAAICCVVLMIGVVFTIYSMGIFPAVQNDNITQKAVYTGTDEAAKSKADVVVAKAGEYELTNGELQVLYWSMVYDLVSYLGDYAAYYIDFTQPLYAQYYNQTDGVTWEHYFLNMALNTWLRYELLADAAAEAGVTMSEELQNELDSMYDTLEAAKESLGFDSVEAMIANDFGAAATFEDYMSYMNIYYKGNNYYNKLYTEAEFTDAEIEAFYTENEQDMISSGYGKDVGKAYEVRHILIEPAEDTEEAWATALKTAQDMLDQWVAGGADEATFANLAYENSACGSYANGGLLDPFVAGDMVAEFEAWCFQDGHVYGDYGLVQTEYGWHIIFFVDSYELWREVSISNLASEYLNEYMAELESGYTMTVEYDRIVLADVPLS